LFIDSVLAAVLCIQTGDAEEFVGPGTTAYPFTIIPSTINKNGVSRSGPDSPPKYERTPLP